MTCNRYSDEIIIIDGDELMVKCMCLMNLEKKECILDETWDWKILEQDWFHNAFKGISKAY